VTPQSVETTALVSPERLRPARFSTLRSSEAPRVPCYVRARSLAPFRPMRSSPSVTRARRAVLPAAPSVRLSAPLGRGKKMLLTDLCNRPTTRAPDGPFDFRAPWLAPPQITECVVGVSRLLPRDAGPPCGNPAPARTRLTARRRASKALAASFQDASPAVGGDPPPRVIDTSGAVHHPAPACSAGTPGRRALLWRPCRPPPRAAPLETTPERRARLDSTVRTSMRPACSNQSAFHRRVLSGAYFRTAPLGESPPPISRLRHQRSGFRRFFTPSSLSRGGARPHELSASSSLTGSRGHAPLVDFCNRYGPRARPRSSELRRTTPRSPVTQRFSRAWLPFDIGLELRMAGLATARFPAPPGQNRSQPRLLGPGAGVDDDRLAPAPPATIARAGALPQPVLCLGHLVSPVRGAGLAGVSRCTGA